MNELITFHPYLTVSDSDNLTYVTMQHRIENALSFVLFGMVSNRLLLSRGPKFMNNSRVFRWPGAALASGIATYIVNKTFLK